MEIQTTINVNKMIMAELDNASGILKLSRTYIIHLLLKQFLEDNNKLKIFQSPVKYQARDDECNWSTFHLTLREDEYEFCLDLRKVYKMSLSFIIAFAVRKHLEKILTLFNRKNNTEITDNYLFHNYYFSFKIIKGIRSFRIYWGITNFEELLTDDHQNTI